MKVQFSKEFAKAMEKLSGKIRNSVVAAINEVINSCNYLLFVNEKPSQNVSYQYLQVL